MKFLILFIFITFNVFSQKSMTYETYDLIPEAKVFRGVTQGGIDYVGFHLGDIRKQPIVLVGGLSLNIVYLRSFIYSLVEEGFSVYAVNLNGYGRGHFMSGKNVDDKDLGISGSIEVIRNAISFAYESSGKQKVVLAGHSSGGMLARISSLGVLLDNNKQGDNNSQIISENLLKSYRSQVSLTVPMFSPLIHPYKEIGKEQRKSLKKLKKYVKALNFVNKTNKKMQGSKVKILRSIHNKIIDFIYKKTLKGDLLIGTEVDENEYRKCLDLILSDKFPKTLKNDLIKWIENFELLSSQGFSFSQQWLYQQNSRLAVPTLLIFGSKDKFTSAPLKNGELKFSKKTNKVELNSGHLGTFYNSELSRDLARKIYLMNEKYSKEIE